MHSSQSNLAMNGIDRRPKAAILSLLNSLRCNMNYLQNQNPLTQQDQEFLRLCQSLSYVDKRKLRDSMRSLLTKEQKIEVAARIGTLMAEARNCRERDFLERMAKKPYSDTAISAEGKSKHC